MQHVNAQRYQLRVIQKNKMLKDWQVIKIIKKIIDITFSSENYFHVQLADKQILTNITYIML